MSDYQNIKAIYDDSNIKLTMERYGYNLWALLALLSIMFILRIVDKVYLYNAILLFFLIVIFSLYYRYIKIK